MKLRFEHSRAGLFVIADQALEVLREHEQHQPDALEAGGYLVGRHLRGGRDVVVDAVTVPQPTDLRERQGFQLDPTAHCAYLRWADQASAGDAFYVGTWHTHPEVRPVPSPLDLESWRREMREDARGDEAQFFVIVGLLEVCVWEARRDLDELLPCPAA